MATYTVKQGDSLSKIAKQYGIGYDKITGYRSGDPNKIFAGEVLNIPDATPPPNTSTPSGPVYSPPPPNTSTPSGPIYTPPPPVVTKPIEAPPMTSYTAVGQQFLGERQKAGLPADELSIKKAYRDNGFEDKYGQWRGTDVQYKAMWQKDIEDSFANMQKRTQEEGITSGRTGEVLQAPQAPPGGGTPSTGGEVNSTYEYTQMGGDDYQKVMDDVLESIGTTDITRLITDFAGGEVTNPEFELSKEDRDAQLEEVKTAATQGLKTLQQGLASKGMTFSGIRTEAEADLAADTLSKEAGINRQFASRIIGAARQEQTRRETALKAAETNYNKALEAQGYVYNPFTNTIERTLAGSRHDLDIAKEVYDQNNPAQKNAHISYQTDNAGNVTKIVSDPVTGQTLGMESIGNIGKGKAGGGDTITSGSLSLPETEIAKAQKALDDSRGTDSYSNSGLYLDLRKTWIDNGGLEQDFYSNIPPSNYLNPKDNTIPAYIKEKLPKVKDTSNEDRLAEVAKKQSEKGGLQKALDWVLGVIN